MMGSTVSINICSVHFAELWQSSCISGNVANHIRLVVMQSILTVSTVQCIDEDGSLKGAPVFSIFLPAFYKLI